MVPAYGVAKRQATGVTNISAARGIHAFNGSRRRSYAYESDARTTSAAPVIAVPWMFAQRASSGNTRNTRRDGLRASAIKSQTTSTNRTNARLCARAFQDPQMSRNIAGRLIQQALRIDAPRQRATTIASANADPAANTWP